MMELSAFQLTMLQKLGIGFLAGLAAATVTYRVAFLKPLKICFVCNNYPAQCRCGQELITLALGWLEHSHEWDDDPEFTEAKGAMKQCGHELKEVLEARGTWPEESSPCDAQEDK